MTINILYPAAIDNSVSIPQIVDNITPVSAETVNRLRAAILAIEAELGVEPAALYGTVRNRLDYLELLIGGAITPPSLGGDLSGTLTSAIVVGLQGKPISNTAATSGQLYVFNG